MFLGAGRSAAEASGQRSLHRGRKIGGAAHSDVRPAKRLSGASELVATLTEEDDRDVAGIELEPRAALEERRRDAAQANPLVR